MKQDSNQEYQLLKLYQQWFSAWANHPDRDYHFNNIKTCIKEDIAQGNLTKNGKAHKQLQEFYLNMIQNIKKI